MTILRSVVATCLLAAAAQPALAAKVYLQDVDGNSGFTFEGTAVTHATFDDSTVISGGINNSPITNNGGGGNLQMRTSSVVERGLMAVTGMFSLLPATDGNGGTLQINAASLHLASSGNYAGGFNLIVRRVTTNWFGTPVTDPPTPTRVAGEFQNFIAGGQRNAATRTHLVNTSYTVAGGIPWAGGGHFGASDYSTSNVVTTTYGPLNYGQYQEINITGIMQDIYASGVNYGIQLSTTSSTNFNVRSSEGELIAATHETFRPVFEIDYEYVGGNAVPEPAGVATLAAGSLALLARRRHDLVEHRVRPARALAGEGVMKR